MEEMEEMAQAEREVGLALQEMAGMEQRGQVGAAEVEEEQVPEEMEQQEMNLIQRMVREEVGLGRDFHQEALRVTEDYMGAAEEKQMGD